MHTHKSKYFIIYKYAKNVSSPEQIIFILNNIPERGKKKSFSHHADKQGFIPWKCNCNLRYDSTPNHN